MPYRGQVILYAKKVTYDLNLIDIPVYTKSL